MAYSAGFSPHPKISYAGAAATGVASEAEYVEIAVTARCDPELVREALDESLPSGLDVLEVVEAGPGSLADRLEASVFEVTLAGVDARTASQAATAFLSAEAVPVDRMTKNGLRTFDARAAVVSLSVRDGAADATPGEGGASADSASGGGCAILRLVVRHTTPAVRPDDVLVALRRVADLAPPVPPSVTRLAQGPLDTETDDVADPLAPDRR